MADPFDLRGKAALVVGGGDAIGRAIAVALAEAGADVAVASCTPGQREEVAVNSCANEVWALGRRSLALAIDCADAAQVEAAVGRTVGELGRLDILVNNQDLPFAKPLPEVTDGEWAQVMARNVTAVFLACRAAGRRLLAQGGGRIINVASILGERGLANAVAYCAAKAAVLNLTRALALEWARSGITVNALGLGFAEGTALGEDQAMREALERYLPHRRLGRPQEMATAAVYMASDASSFFTGQVIYADGAALAHE